MAYFAVAVGGFVGACLRYLIAEWMGTLSGFPIATFLINVFGSFFLAWFYTITSERFTINPHIRLGIGTGLVGAFTTFSTFTVDTWKLADAGLWSIATWYVLLTLIFGILAAFAGYWIAYVQSRIRVVERRKEV